MIQPTPTARENPPTFESRLYNGAKGIIYTVISLTTAYGTITSFTKGTCRVARIGERMIPVCSGGPTNTAVITLGLPTISFMAATAAKECFQECFR